MTVTEWVLAGIVTDPAGSLIVPVEADAMLCTNAGSSKTTCPEGAPVSRRVTASPLAVIVTPILLLPVVGKLATEMGRPEVSQLPGTPRPTMSVPSARWAASESSRPRPPMAIPQECGEEPPPLAGWSPVHGVVVLGEVEPSHQAYGPLWSWAIRNS